MKNISNSLFFARDQEEDKDLFNNIPEFDQKNSKTIFKWG